MDILIRAGQSKEKIEELTLVLSASSIPYQTEETKDGWVIYVHRSDIDRCRQILCKYEDENQGWTSKITAKQHYKKTFSGLAITLLLFIIYLVMKLKNAEAVWFQIGNASSEQILGGEWWRAVTALFIHGSNLHILSNVICCLIFCSAVCSYYGFGLGWLLILLSGIGGNIITAFIYQTNHYSIGASTAIFGAVGLLGAWRFVCVRKHPLFRKRAWVYIVVVIALLAFLGAGNNVDLAAHMTGGATGCILGWAAAKGITRPVSMNGQSVLAVLSVAIIIVSWLLALKVGI